MPKKRHQTKYSKPQSTAPASLGSSRRDNSSINQHGDRGVNELLADLRRLSLTSSPATDPTTELVATPSVPPAIRHILQLPETPGPPPRRPLRYGPDGRRLPPGPAAPRSWLARSRHAPSLRPQPQPSPSSTGVGHAVRAESLPGVFVPARRSMVDLVVRRLVLDWPFHKSYNRFYLPMLPSHIRATVISYLSTLRDEGVSLADLRALLQPADQDQRVEGDFEDEGPEELQRPSESTALNEDVASLDVTGSIGTSLMLKELSHFLFPSPSQPIAPPAPQDSWDAPPDTHQPPPSSLPLLPSLTHLNLSLSPSRPAATSSWRPLLSLATHLPQLTHLSLAFWPAPTLTPNARLATVASPQGGRIPYGGTSAYSHTALDDDWSEAVAVLRRLGKALYGLECLDLTGCARWRPALVRRVDHDEVDWVGDWGKVTRLRLCSGVGEDEPGSGASVNDIERLVEMMGIGERETPADVERHITRMRAGKGRMITVERDQALA